MSAGLPPLILTIDTFCAMKAEILNRATYVQVASLHEVYSNLVDIYEQIMEGPRNCVGIPEYYAARSSRDACYRRIIELQDSL